MKIIDMDQSSSAALVNDRGVLLNNDVSRFTINLVSLAVLAATLIHRQTIANEKNDTSYKTST